MEELKSIDATVALVYKMVEEITGVNKTMIQGSNRSVGTVDARKIISCILRNRLNLSCEKTASYMNKDHSSISYYQKMHANHIHEPEYRRMYSAVAGMLAIHTSVKSVDVLREKLIDLNDQAELLLKAIKSQSKIIDVLEMEEAHSN